MKFDPILCPECGEPARGTVETMRGVALLTDPDPTGCVEYEGETEMDGGGPETVHHPDYPALVRLVCEAGHEWWARELPAEPEAKPAGDTPSMLGRYGSGGIATRGPFGTTAASVARAAIRKATGE